MMSNDGPVAPAAFRRCAVWFALAAALIHTGGCTHQTRSALPATPADLITEIEREQFAVIAKDDGLVTAYRGSYVRTRNRLFSVLAERRIRALVSSRTVIERSLRNTARRFGSVGAIGSLTGNTRKLAGSCVLVAPDMVLTAKHVGDLVRDQRAVVYFGNMWEANYRTDWEVPFEAVPVAEMPEADLALFRLQRHVPGWLARPADLSALVSGAMVKVDDRIMLVGYGRDDIYSLFHDLKPRADVPERGIRRAKPSHVYAVAADSPERERFKFFIGSNASTEGNSNLGDSGGGIFSDTENGPRLVGITLGNVANFGWGGSFACKPEVVSAFLREYGLFK